MTDISFGWHRHGAARSTSAIDIEVRPATQSQGTRVTIRIAGSANEFRRLGGDPDVSPLFEVVASALERWLVDRVAALDPGASPERDDAARAGPERHG